MFKMVSSFVAVLGLAVLAGTPGQSQTPSLTTLVNFDTYDGIALHGTLIADANGNLFGTTLFGGGGDVGQGTVFMIEKTASGYASTPTTLYRFCPEGPWSGCPDGGYPNAGLLADANGNLFGTTIFGGENDNGTVFEIAKTASGYASAPTVLVRFNGADGGGLWAGVIADANGNLVGATAYGGENGRGTVFEIAKTATGYASAPTVLVSFNGANGSGPGALLADASGNLFGTTSGGGANGQGTVFEIAKTASGYASTPTVLVSFSFNGINGWGPSSLFADASGNLFGTTYRGGANDKGTVFEVARTASGYASAPTFLVSFNGADAAYPEAGVIADANGNLFGTTGGGGGTGETVFEIAKTASGYASTPTILYSFCTLTDCADGWWPEAGLLADAEGNLFGTTAYGGANNAGTVFELQGSGFVPFSVFAGKRGTPNCVGVSVSALAQQYGGINNAAAARGYATVAALQDAVRAWCRVSK